MTKTTCLDPLRLVVESNFPSQNKKTKQVDFGVRPPIRDNFGSRRPFSFVLGSFESAIDVLSNPHIFGFDRVAGCRVRDL